MLKENSWITVTADTKVYLLACLRIAKVWDSTRAKKILVIHFPWPGPWQFYELITFHLPTEVGWFNVAPQENCDQCKYILSTFLGVWKTHFSKFIFPKPILLMFWALQSLPTYRACLLVTIDLGRLRARNYQQRGIYIDRQIFKKTSKPCIKHILLVPDPQRRFPGTYLSMQLLNVLVTTTSDGFTCGPRHCTTIFPIFPRGWIRTRYLSRHLSSYLAYSAR